VEKMPFVLFAFTSQDVSVRNVILVVHMSDVALILLVAPFPPSPRLLSHPAVEVTKTVLSELLATDKMANVLIHVEVHLATSTRNA